MRPRSLLATRHPIVVLLIGALLAVAAPQFGIASMQEELSARAAVSEQLIAELRGTAELLSAGGADAGHLSDAGKDIDGAEKKLEIARKMLAQAAAKDAEADLIAQEGNDAEAEQVRAEADQLRADAEDKLDAVDANLVEAQADLILSVLRDGTSAVAVNTRDGASIFKFAFEILMVTDDSVVGNTALAIASCTECQTLALATQIILMSSDGTVSPENLAFALNVDCDLCQTAAFGYQFLFTTEEDFTLSKDGSKTIDEIRRQMMALGRAYLAGELTVVELDAALDPLVEQLGIVLADEVAAFAALHASPSSTESSPGISPTPTESASASILDPASSQTPTPADSSGTSGEEGTTIGSNDPAPSESPTPSESPSETPSESPSPNESPPP